MVAKDAFLPRQYPFVAKIQTGQICQTIDVLKFKDGYLYKKVSIESISYVDVVLSTDELLKFKPYKKDTFDDAEWLSHLYGEQWKRRLSECSNGATKGSEGTSGSKKGNQFQLHNLVFFGPKDFGVIIGVESDGFQPTGNGGYFCAKSQMCENISNSNGVHHESIGNVFGAPRMEDSTGSPKSLELFKKPWEEKENTRDFNIHRKGDRDGAFSVGQTLRIRIGPLKGHLCRVVAIYRSDITVKVDSQTKVLSVKCEHLSEVGMKSNFMTRNDGFGTQEGGYTSIKNPFDSLVTDDPEKGDDPWGSKATSKKATNSWGNTAGFGGDLGKGRIWYYCMYIAGF
ncbi:hypothetical protein IFM89_031217 [Coptis chinensis]|uniref:Spt5 KOWx domain-containing protein n=1 Tax=Coptis chinensis TaxID=261450 RepID=A0A835IRT8_9MAGN|nr:hypothetical protein IFM89_031217 [Coptis chinensis]